MTQTDEYHSETCSSTYAHTHARTHTQAHTHTSTHTHTHKHTHTHTHKQTKHTYTNSHTKTRCQFLDFLYQPQTYDYIYRLNHAQGGLVGSVDRASDFGSEGLKFDSRRLCYEFYPWER